MTETNQNPNQGNEAWNSASQRPRPKINVADPLASIGQTSAKPAGQARATSTDSPRVATSAGRQRTASTNAAQPAPATPYGAQTNGNRTDTNQGTSGQSSTNGYPQQAYRASGTTANQAQRTHNQQPTCNTSAFARSNYGTGAHRPVSSQQIAAQGLRQANGQGRSVPSVSKKKRHTPKVLAVMAAILVICGAGAFGGYQWYTNHPVSVTINGSSTTIEGTQRSIQGLIEAGTVTPTAGNHLAVDGSIITQGGGEAASVTLNGATASDFATLLQDGDSIEVTNGKDTTEEYTEETKETKPAKASVKVTGRGAIHQVSAPSKETVKVITGKESGLTKTTVVKKSSGLTVKRYNGSTKKKVIALTFDDGPWPTTTDEILDILKENDAKATFFTIGKQISSRKSSVTRMKDEGHQICTHTYDHASGSGRGVNITYMSKKEQRNEITKGYEAIKAVTGEDASTVVRLPGGNVNEDAYSNLSNLITAEINWSIDTEDWSRPGVDSIYNRIVSASSGDVILMHDGGGDRSQTVEALKKALPVLKEKGYSFVTIDELLKDSE